MSEGGMLEISLTGRCALPDAAPGQISLVGVGQDSAGHTEWRYSPLPIMATPTDILSWGDSNGIEANL